MAVLLLASRSGAASRDWSSQIVYHVFTRSYRDSNGDGHGDFRGLEQGLDTIKGMGFTALMINPVAKSRVYHNYFADDMMTPDPRYGSLADFRHLLHAAHRKGMKVVLDMEPQYVADHQLWFASWIENHNSPYAPYLWIAGSPDWGSGKNWYDGQTIRVATVDPANPKVQAYITKVFRFWASQGVDGFRIDHMMDDLDNKHFKTGLLTTLWAPVERAVRRDHPETFFIGEQSDWLNANDVKRIFKETPTDATFAFPLREALLSLDKAKIEAAVNQMTGLIPPGRTQFTFLENHDTGRLASVQPDVRKQRLMAALLFTLPGTPSIYYGQELGMKGLQGHWGTDGNDIPVRLGYRWSAALADPRTPHWYAGTGPWAKPVFSKDNDGISLAEEMNKPGSLLNFYRRLIRLRKAYPELWDGNIRFIESGSPSMLAFERAGQIGPYNNMSGMITIYANLSDQSAVIQIPVGTDAWMGKELRDKARLGPYEFAIVPSSLGWLDKKRAARRRPTLLSEGN